LVKSKKGGTMPKREELEVIVAWLENELSQRAKQLPGRITQLAGTLLLEAQKKCGGSGVGRVYNPKKAIDILYINRPEQREPTIIYDGFADKFMIGHLEEMIELYEMLGESDAT
jgi:hypothetical protein